MLCVIAKLNDEATERLEALRKAACPAAAQKPLYGHITLAAYTGADEAGFMRSCRALLRGVSPFSVTYNRIAVLSETSIVAALPMHSEPLEALHRRIVEAYGNELDEWTGTDRYLPHTTLLFAPTADLFAAHRRMNEVFVSFSAAVQRIEFSRVTDRGYEIVGRAELSPGG